VRENGRTYVPLYTVAFAFIFLFSGTIALCAWMMRDVVKLWAEPAALPATRSTPSP
jgi:hypothetical protein